MEESNDCERDPRELRISELLREPHVRAWRWDPQDDDEVEVCVRRFTPSRTKRRLEDMLMPTSIVYVAKPPIGPKDD